MTFGSILGEFRLTSMQLWRESAQSFSTGNQAYALSSQPCERREVASLPSNQPATYCHYRYPSPRRFEPLRFGPTPLDANRAKDKSLKLRCNYIARENYLVLKGQQSASEDGEFCNILISEKGHLSCLESVYSSPPPLSSPSRLAILSTLTQSAVSSVLAVVRLPQLSLAQTRLPVPSLVARRVYSATTSAFASKTIIYRATARLILSCRRPGISSGGGFAF